MNLNVLLVEDDPGDMESYRRDFPVVFKECGIDATLHEVSDFDDAYELITSSHIRYDLILSDTYRGNLRNRDAAVVRMVQDYRKGRFCPLVVFSASTKPDVLDIGAFVSWADKSVSGEIESVIKKLLETGIPQLARQLHDELDRSAGSFLWDFLEKEWANLWPEETPDAEVLERLVRRRAALQLAEIGENVDEIEPISSIAGLEYYIYPPLHRKSFRLGHVVKSKSLASDLRVVLTPHCHLEVQQGNDAPRAKHVLTVKTTAAIRVLGTEKIENAKGLKNNGWKKKLRSWATPPSGQEVGKPSGRFWYLPAFLEIPHAYCDFQQIEALSFADLTANYTPIATLTAPFSESLQSCFLAYYGGVGIPNIRPDSILSLLESSPDGP